MPMCKDPVYGAALGGARVGTLESVALIIRIQIAAQRWSSLSPMPAGTNRVGMGPALFQNEAGWAGFINEERDR